MFLNLTCYALINRARGPYEEIFVLTFKAYGPNAVWVSRWLHALEGPGSVLRVINQSTFFPVGKSGLDSSRAVAVPNLLQLRAASVRHFLYLIHTLNLFCRIKKYYLSV